MLEARQELLAVNEGDSGAEVTRERCAFIYRRIVPALALSLGLSALLSVHLWHRRPVDLIVMWLGLSLVAAAGFGLLALAYKRAPREGEAVWIRRAALAAAVVG